MSTINEMKKALNDVVIPRLRERGFKGSLPHFRRFRDDRVDLLMFQFDKWGGGFVIEVGHCSPQGMMTSWGGHIPAEKMKAYYLNFNCRERVQPRKGGSPNDWFRYDSATRPEEFAEVAQSVIPLLEHMEEILDRLPIENECSEETQEKIAPPFPSGEDGKPGVIRRFLGFFKQN
ncbi:MAG: DUF4304 domain-containing protein [Armatimonadota bacterium]